MAAAEGYDLPALKAALESAEFTVAEVFSPIQGSPYDRLEVYLTSKTWEGAYIIVSDRKELEDEPGTLVGAYRDYETPEGEDGPVACDSLEETMAAVRAAVEALR
jgi:hypothetical protein